MKRPTMKRTVMHRIRIATPLLLALACMPVMAQTVGMVEDWYDLETNQREQEDAEQDARDEAGRGAVDQGLALTTWGVGVVQSAHEFYDNWNALDEDSADCGAAYNDASAPTVPSQCAEDEACERCYAEAVRKIDFNRFYIERAYCITAVNVKMANSAMAFGDSTSGIHGVAGLSWQLQGKPQIKQAVDQLKRTYRDKAGQYLHNLDEALRELGQCEAEHYGERDWYQRYGWIYLNFMKARYASPPD